jgi:hypothetical protein
MTLVGSGVSKIFVGSGVLNSVGNGVGRCTPGVGAKVLLVPAFADGIQLNARRRKMESFMLVVESKMG